MPRPPRRGIRRTCSSLSDSRVAVVPVPNGHRVEMLTGTLKLHRCCIC